MEHAEVRVARVEVAIGARSAKVKISRKGLGKSHSHSVSLHAELVILLTFKVFDLFFDGAFVLCILHGHGGRSQTWICPVLSSGRALFHHVEYVDFLIGGGTHCRRHHVEEGGGGLATHRRRVNYAREQVWSRAGVPRGWRRSSRRLHLWGRRLAPKRRI